MPYFTAQGDLVGAIGNLPLWIWPRAAAKPQPLLIPNAIGDLVPAIGGGSIPRDANSFVAQITNPGVTRIVEFIGAGDKWTPTDYAERGANWLRAGAGNILATLDRPPAGKVRTVGTIWGDTIETNNGVGVVDPVTGGYTMFDVTRGVAYVVFDRNDDPLINPHANPFILSSNFLVRNMRNGLVFGHDNRQVLSLFNAAGAVPFKTVGGQLWATLVFTDGNGRVWLCYFSAILGIVIHPADDASRGYRLGMNDINGLDYHDAGNGSALFAWATGEGEAINTLIRTEFTLGANMEPFAPVVVVPPPQPPPTPDPEPPPTGDDDMAIPDSELDRAFDALTLLRAQYPAGMSNDECVDMINRAAWLLTATGHPWGLLSKPGGNNGRRSDGELCSVDFLVHVPTRTGFDCLREAGAGGPSTPVLGEQETFELGRIVLALKPAGTGNPPPDPPPTDPPPTEPPPSGDMLATLNEVNRKCTDLLKLHNDLVLGISNLIIEVGKHMTAIEEQQKKGYRGTARVPVLGTVSFDLTPKD